MIKKIKLWYQKQLWIAVILSRFRPKRLVKECSLYRNFHNRLYYFQENGFEVCSCLNPVRFCIVDKVRICTRGKNTTPITQEMTIWEAERISQALYAVYEKLTADKVIPYTHFGKPQLKEYQRKDA